PGRPRRPSDPPRTSLGNLVEKPKPDLHKCRTTGDSFRTRGDRSMIISKLLRRADRSSRFFQPDRRPVRRFMPWADGLEDRISLSIIILGGAGGVLGGSGSANGGGGNGNGGNASGGAIANSGASFSDNQGTFTNNQANGGN